MYFSNIANDELQHFHRTSGADFTMSLTDILASNLFEVETIIADKLYRVYPLFYCNTIITNNNNDKNLDNRVLILEKRQHETYVTFIMEENTDNIIMNEDVIKTKQIGDKLNADDFNRMVYMFRQKGVLTGNINFENSNSITGQYATYTFENVDEQLRNDTGIIINDKIKNNPLTVKLENPFFISARYVLVCTVISLTGANIYDDNTDYKVKDTFNVELVNGSSVAIDVTDYTNDSVLDFIVEVDISFDVPEIVNSNFLLSLSSDEDYITIESDLLLTANLTGSGNVSDYNIKFYEDDVLIGVASTDENGVAVFNYTPSIVSNHVYSARAFGLESSVNVEVGKYVTGINLTTNKSIAYIPTTFTINGVCSRGNGVLSNANVRLLSNNNLIDTVTTDANGTFSKTITTETTQTYNLQAVYDGSSENSGCISNIKNVVARKLNTNLTITTDKTSMYYTEVVTVSGKLTDELGVAITNATITIYENNIEIDTLTTNNQGEYTYTKQYNEIGAFTFKTSYSEDATHTGKTSANKTVTVNKAPVTITITPTKTSYDMHEQIEISLSSDYGSFTANKISISNAGEFNLTNNRCNFETYPANTNDVLSITYAGSDYYQQITKYIDLNNPVSSLSLAVVSGKLFIRTGVANYSLKGLVIYDVNNPFIQYTFDNNTYKTNANGNYAYTMPIGRSTVYAKYGSVTSNTITINVTR